MAEVDFEVVFDDAPVPAAVLTTDMVIVAVNRAYEKATGRGREDLVGRGIFEVFPGGHGGIGARELRDSLERVLAEGEIDIMPFQRYDVAVPGRPAQERYWNVTNAPVKDAEGAIRWLIVRAEDVTGYIDELRRIGETPPRGEARPDVTKIRMMEAELFARSRELQEVNQRLRNAQAGDRQTVEGLRRVMSRQRDVVADASHDLRGPITGLQTRLQDALMDPGADWRRIMLAALQDAERLGDIVADLLDLARLESGAPPPLTEPVDLARLVEAELSQRRRPDATVTVRVPSGPVTVLGSPLRLARLLENLMSNAERHARGRIEVSVAREGGWAVLEIADDGPGIPAAERKAVFTRFYRRADAHDTDPSGSGLGLPITRDIAHAHGGTLHIADRPGFGACFVLRIPLADGGSSPS